MRAARWLLKEREEFLEKVKREGEDLLEEARSQAKAERVVNAVLLLVVRCQNGSEEGEPVLRKLPEGLRQVVELGVYQDLPYAEIAEILSIPVGTVKSRMFNALAKLRAFLEK